MIFVESEWLLFVIIFDIIFFLTICYNCDGIRLGIWTGYSGVTV